MPAAWETSCKIEAVPRQRSLRIASAIDPPRAARDNCFMHQRSRQQPDEEIP